jgi:hypothetical protein
MESNSIFFQCKVLNTEDPMMLGRIRGIRLIDNENDILKSVSDPPWNEEKDIWTSRDPLVFNIKISFTFRIHSQVQPQPSKSFIMEVINLQVRVCKLKTQNL